MPSLEQIRRQKRLAEEKAKRDAVNDDTGGGTQDAVDAANTERAADTMEPEVVKEPEVIHGSKVEMPEPAREPVVQDEAEPETISKDSGSDEKDVDVQVPASGEMPAAGALEEAPEASDISEPVKEEAFSGPLPEVPVEAGDVPEPDGNEVLEEGTSGQEPKKSSGKGKPVQQSRKRRGRKGVAEDFKEDGTIRVDLPAKLVAMARSQFPEASNKTEAVAAWMYAKSDKTMDVPESIKKLAATYTGDQMSNLVKDVSERLAVLDSRTLKMQMLTDGRVQEMWYMIAYLMLERMDALAKTHMKDLDLTLPVFETLRSEVNGQFRKVRNRQQIQDGRQVYQRKVGGKRADIT